MMREASVTFTGVKKNIRVINVCLVIFFTMLNIQKYQAQTPIVIPNVFTPNNDGINDVFFINFNGYSVSNFDLKIYNCWGVQLFASQNNNISWDGTTTAGVKVPEGTYYYVIRINNTDYKGALALIY